MKGRPHSPSRFKEEGQQAHRAGLKVSDNPYIGHTAAAKEWEDGWWLSRNTQ